MNKSLLKNFATAARVRLMDDVRYRLGLMGITAKGIAAPVHQSLDMETYEYARGQTYRLTGADVAARSALADLVRTRGFDQVVEEVAYTWFNRLIAIRFMEVNDYLPHHTRVLSSITPGQTTPDIVTRALDIDLGLTDTEKQRVLDWKLNNQTDELFRFLFLKQCQQLGKVLPRLFIGHKRGDYYSPYLGNEPGFTGFEDDPLRLLLTISCISKDGIVAKLLEVPESYFNVSAVDEDGEPTGQVEIIGWMYQYYNSELKDQTFAQLKGSNKISKERIPAATQLFTPQWIVKYLVENSLGRLWADKLLAEGDSRTEEQIANAFDWRYYLPEAEQPPEVAEKLKQQRKARDIHSPEDLRFLDPCMGSGHILVYAFDVLMQIYLSVGYSERDAAKSIVENNLYGLDIDDRAAQLAYFALMMKARQYDSRFLTRSVQPHVYAIQESNALQPFERLSRQMRLDTLCLNTANDLIATYRDAKEYGSLLSPKINSLPDVPHLMRQLEEVSLTDLEIQSWYEKAARLLPQLARQTEVLQQRYDVVVTNPPYMGSSSMNALLSSYVKEEYPDSKSDLFAVFIERCGNMTVKGGYTAMITQHAWMFLSSYEKLRKKMNRRNIINMAHLGPRAFDEIGGEVVQTTAFVLSASHIPGYQGTYCRLIDPTTQQGKEDMFLAGDNRFLSVQDNFSKIPGSPVAYWLSNKFINVFENDKLMKYAAIQEGLKTGDNNRFIRYWFEVRIKDTNIVCEEAKWIKHTKGGEFRKWYGNNEEVLNYANNGEELRQFKGSSLTGTENYFLENITWNRITSNQISVRFTPPGSIPNMAGLALYPTSNLFVIIAYMNTVVVQQLLDAMNPTINYPPGTIAKIPFLLPQNNFESVQEISKTAIKLSQSDWDSYETSWDFKKHPLI